MTLLAIYPESGGAPDRILRDGDRIADELRRHGLMFERWFSRVPLSPEAGQDEVLEAFTPEVMCMNHDHGFKTVDVVSIHPEHPEREALRRKFLDEHTHADFEVRYFVDGRGLFYLHLGDEVYLLLCEKGDLISIPANTPHWFDMGTAPDFKCIRFFTTPEGWVDEPTGSDIARRFPDFDSFVAAQA